MGKKKAEDNGRASTTLCSAGAKTKGFDDKRKSRASLTDEQFAGYGINQSQFRGLRRARIPHGLPETAHYPNSFMASLLTQ
jgi:hypothetical protein